MNHKIEQLNADKYAPYVIKLENDGAHAVDFIAQNKDLVEELVRKSGALLIRGGGFDTPGKVQQVSELFFEQALTGNTEHRPIEKGLTVQRPVEYSPKEFLLWHNENTFNHSFPSRAIFACELPAAEGGQTPVVDSRAVLENLDEKIKQEFLEKGVMYVRKYEDHDFIGLGWKTIFETTDKAEVEQKCREKHMGFEWINGNTLITRAVRPAIFEHPQTGEMTWINQLLHWHFHCLSPTAQADIKMLFEHEHLYPRNCYFGDGSKIPDEYIDHIHSVYQKNHMEFDWQKGDLLLVDNILKAHSRNAYQGERKVMVCFGDPISFSQA